MQSIDRFQPVVQGVLVGPGNRKRLASTAKDSVAFTGAGRRIAVLALATAVGLPAVTACSGSNGPKLAEIKPVACTAFMPTAEEQVARTPEFPKGALCQLGPATLEPLFGIKGVLQIPFLAWDKDHFIQRIGLYQKSKNGTYEPIPLGLTADTAFKSEETDIQVQGSKVYLPNGDIIDGPTARVYRFTSVGSVTALQCQASQVTEWDKKLSESQLPPGALCRLSFQKEKEAVIFNFLFWDSQRQSFFVQQVEYQADAEGRLIRKAVLPDSKKLLYGDAMGITFRDGFAYLPDGSKLEGGTGMLYRLEPVGQIRTGD
jgi:hypothetical protein